MEVLISNVMRWPRLSTYLSSSLSSLESPSRVSASLSGARGSPGSEETVQFMMVNSLLSESYESWMQHGPAFLQRGIICNVGIVQSGPILKLSNHAYMQHKHGRSILKLLAESSSPAVRLDEGSSADPNDSKRLFGIVQSVLVYTGLIEQLQQFFKKGKSSGTSKSSEKDAKWECTMKEKDEQHEGDGGSIKGSALVARRHDLLKICRRPSMSWGH